MFSNPTQVARIAEWAFDTHVSQISAVDQHGRVLMAIAASPLFGPRLAAAFCWPVSHTATFGIPVRSASEHPR